ncbi:MAG: hypothetical protein AAGF04_04400 [Chlamydiota bacterium]
MFFQEPDVSKKPKQATEFSVTKFGEPLHKIQPRPYKKLSYSELVCTDEEKFHICLIIRGIAEQGYIQLLNNKSTFDEWKEKVKRVHPLKFLEFIFQNSDLSEHMVAIIGDFAKGMYFANELSANLQARHAVDDVVVHIPDFAAKLALPVKVLHDYCVKEKWQSLLFYLVEQKNPPKNGNTLQEQDN